MKFNIWHKAKNKEQGNSTSSKEHTYIEENAQTPKVSVLIPVLQAFSEFEIALQNIKGQTYPNLEVIIVADTPKVKPIKKIVEKVAPKDKRFKLYANTKNLGILVTRRVAFLYSSGDLVYYIDADDYVNSPTVIEDLVNIWKKENQPDILEASHRNILKKENLEVLFARMPKDEADQVRKNLTFTDDVAILTNLQKHTEIIDTKESRIIEKKLLNKIGTTFIWNKLIKRQIAQKAYDAIPIARINHQEDLLQTVFFYHFAKKIVLTEYVAYSYRQNFGITNIVTFSLHKIKNDINIETVFSVLFNFFDEHKEEYPQHNALETFLSQKLFTELIKITRKAQTLSTADRQKAFDYLNQAFGEKLIQKVIATTNKTD